MNKFRALVSLLRREVAPIVPVRVQLRPNLKGGVWGYCWLVWKPDNRPSHFVIQVCSRTSWEVIRGTLLHEWAHALAWSEAHNVTDDHGPEWGLAMSRVYQAAVEQ